MAKVTTNLCFGHRLLAIVCKAFLLKKDIKTARCIWLLWQKNCISRIQIDEAIASTCVEAEKEALVRRKLRQLLTPPGTCLIDNATLLNAMCDALLPYL